MKSLRNGLLIAVLLLLLTFNFTLAQDTTAEPAVSATEEAASSETVAPAPASGGSGLVTALRHTHSLVRWLVVIAAVAAVIKFGLGLAQNTEYDSLARRIMLAFSGLTSLQWLIGIIFLVVLGSNTGTFGIRYWWEHAVVMTVAVAVSHMHNRWKNADSQIRYRNGLLIVLAVLALVVVGVALLPQGWRIAPV